MKRQGVRRVPVLVLLGCLLVAVMFLGTPLTSGSDELPACSDLAQAEVVVTLDEPEKEVVQLCRGPGGIVIMTTLTGTIVEESETTPEEGQ